MLVVSRESLVFTIAVSDRVVRLLLLAREGLNDESQFETLFSPRLGDSSVIYFATTLVYEGTNKTEACRIFNN